MGGCHSRAVVSMQVQDRETGKLMDETVPSYLRSIYRLMYQNPVGRQLIKFPVTTTLLRRATARHGVLMDSAESAAQIPKFIETYGVNVDEIELPLDSYPTFNDFFSRRLKPGVRPIDSPHNAQILVSPADCRLLVFPSVEETTKFWLKGQKFTVASLLGPQWPQVQEKFTQPAIAIARLAPQDYHRWHLPLPARVGRRASIGGTYFSVSPRAVREVDILTTNKREVCLFESEEVGTWALVAVGAAMVSSIVISSNIVEGSTHPKGAEHGYFQFGGSTLIMVFDQHTMAFDEDLLENSRKPIETYVKVGTRIGRVRTAKERIERMKARAMAAAAAEADGLSVTIPMMPSPSPSPVSPSLVSRATVDSSQHEAALNDQGLLEDLPALQSNLTLMQAHARSQTVPTQIPDRNGTSADDRRATRNKKRKAPTGTVERPSPESDKPRPDDDTESDHGHHGEIHKLIQITDDEPTDNNNNNDSVSMDIDDTPPSGTNVDEPNSSASMQGNGRHIRRYSEARFSFIPEDSTYATADAEAEAEAESESAPLLQSNGSAATATTAPASSTSAASLSSSHSLSPVPNRRTTRSTSTSTSSRARRSSRGRKADNGNDDGNDTQQQQQPPTKRKKNGNTHRK